MVRRLVKSLAAVTAVAGAFTIGSALGPTPAVAPVIPGIDEQTASSIVQGAASDLAKQCPVPINVPVN